MTLIELLVVIGVILVLASLMLIISPRLSEDQRSVRTADIIGAQLLQAKHRAYRDQQTRGVRLLVTAGTTEVKELQLIERPEDYRGGILQSPSPAPEPPTVPPAATVFIHGKDLTNNQWTLPTPPVPPLEPFIVEQGDFLVFDSIETVPYNSHHIYKVQFFPKGTVPGKPDVEGTHIVLSSNDNTYYSQVNSGVAIPAMPSKEFRFVRKARPLAGEANVQLPKDMIIDLGLTAAQGGSIVQANPEGTYEILFSARGQVIGTNGLGGKVILRVRNGTRGPLDGDQLFVVVYTRSGLVTTHPVDLTFDAAGNLVSPYRFVRDGNSSGL